MGHLHLLQPVTAPMYIDDNNVYISCFIGLLLLLYISHSIKLARACAWATTTSHPLTLLSTLTLTDAVPNTSSGKEQPSTDIGIMHLPLLPEELLLEILIRLPPKSLLRFRSVSKYWHSLIISANLLSLQINLCHVARKYSVLFRQYLYDERIELFTLHDIDVDDGENVKEIGRYDFPYKSDEQWFRILGCINGLLCVCHTYKLPILWNPSIRKCLVLPKINTKPWRYYPWECRIFGFGFDSSVKDYKVVSVAFHFMEDYKHRDVEPVSTSVDVYSLATKSWRNIDVSPPRLFYGFSSVCLDGVLYGVAHKNDDCCVIVSFDLKLEVFMEISCPDDVVRASLYGQKLGVVHNSIALVHPTFDEVDRGQFHIWVMSDDGIAKSWTKLYSIDIEGFLSVLGFGRDGQVALVGNGNWVVCPLVETPKVVHFVPGGSTFGRHMESYMESLVLLQEGDDIPPPLPKDADDKKVENKRSKRRRHK